MLQSTQAFISNDALFLRRHDGALREIVLAAVDFDGNLASL